MAKSYVVVGLLVSSLAGCAVDQPELGSTAGISFEEFKARVSREPGTENYVVDWDIVVHGDDELLDFYYRFQQGALAIYSVNGTDVKWNATQKKNLTYCISNNFGTRKQTVIDALKTASDNGSFGTFSGVYAIPVTGDDDDEDGKGSGSGPPGSSEQRG